MTQVAFSLAALSTPGGKYTERRRKRIADARAWADTNGYTLPLDAPAEVGAYAGTKPVLGMLGALQQSLQEGKIARGTVLILDDLSDFAEPTMRSALPLLMALVQHGLCLVTLRDNRLWDEQSMNDLDGFMLSVILAYAADVEEHLPAVRARHAREKKMKLAGEGSAQ